MSRCFPYPPPGFERPARSKPTDTLEKDKHKEKKHKKDKREKYREEGKERRHKHRSKEKYRDKHDRRDEHNGKKKHKDRVKDKTRMLEEATKKTNEARHEERNGGFSHKTAEVDESKFTKELGRRIRDQEKRAAGQMVENFGNSLRRGFKKLGDAGGLGDAVKRIAPNFINVAQRRTDVPGPGTAMHKETLTTDRLVLDLKISRERENGAVHRHVENSSGSVQRSFGGPSVASMGRMEEDPGNRIMSSSSNTLQRTIPLEMEGENISKMLTNHHFMEHAKKEGMVQYGEKITSNSSHEKSDNIKSHKERRHKNGDEQRNRKEKDKLKKKKHKKEYIEKDEHKLNNDELVESIKKSPAVSEGMKPVPLHKEAGKNAGTDENTKKRRDFEMIGSLHEHNVRPSKISRTTPSSLPVENNKNIQKIHALPSSIRPCGTSDTIKRERLGYSKEQKRHSIEEVHCSAADLRLPALVTCENSEDFKRIPHLDEKYLSQVYSVPKMEEWLEFDCQDWLFKDCLVQSKPKTGMGVNETPCVWALAVRLESADVIALPYVLPF